LGSVVIVCGLGGWVTWRYSDLGRASAELDQAVVDAKAAGLPWVAKDMEQQPPVGDAENAAAIISKADQMRTVDANVMDALVEFGKAQTARDDFAVDASLKRLEPLVSLARQAGDRPRCDFHRDWDLGPWLLFPEFACQKQLSKVLAASATREARAGDWDRCFADLKRSFQMGKHAGSDPCLIGMLVDIACDAIALREAERVAEAAHDNPRQLAALQGVLAGIGPEPDFKIALKGEVYLGIAAIRNLHSLRDVVALSGEVGGEGDGAPRRPRSFVRSGNPPTTFGRIFLCRHLQFWTRMSKAMRTKSDPQELGKILDAAGTEEEHAGLSHYLNRILLPVFSQAGQSIVKMKANRLVSRCLVAVLEYKAKHGRYPKSLAEAGCNEIDPFSGKPLVYHVLGAGCKIYSVGPDGEDDNGIRRNELPDGANQDKGWDVVASYPAYRGTKAKGRH